MKKVRAIDDIIFEGNEEMNIAKGTVFAIEDVAQGGVILNTEEGERFLLDFETFENGFEIAEL